MAFEAVELETVLNDKKADIGREIDSLELRIVELQKRASDIDQLLDIFVDNPELKNLLYVLSGVNKIPDVVINPPPVEPVIP